MRCMLQTIYEFHSLAFFLLVVWFFWIKMELLYLRNQSSMEFDVHLQSVSPHLSLGGEVFWAGQHRKSGIGYAARYNTDKMVQFSTFCWETCPKFYAPSSHIFFVFHLMFTPDLNQSVFLFVANIVFNSSLAAHSKGKNCLLRLFYLDHWIVQFWCKCFCFTRRDQFLMCNCICCLTCRWQLDKLLALVWLL